MRGLPGAQETAPAVRPAGKARGNQPAAARGAEPTPEDSHVWTRPWSSWTRQLL